MRTQCELSAMHRDEGSMALRLRRPIQAADDLIDAVKDAGCSNLPRKRK
jgi:hypothetical protein